MALHHTLEIYKAAQDLAELAVKVTGDFPRNHRMLLGADLMRHCLDLGTQVYRANCARDKVPHLTALLEQLEIVEQELRLGTRLRFIKTPHYANAIKLTDSIGKQANGW